MTVKHKWIVTVEVTTTGVDRHVSYINALCKVGLIPTAEVGGIELIDIREETKQ